MKQIQILHEISSLFNQLIIYRSLKNDPLIIELLDSLETIDELTDIPALSGWYGAILEQAPHASNPWAEYLSGLIKNNENYFSLACEKGSYPNLPPNLLTAVQSDLKNLSLLLSWNPGPMFTGTNGINEVFPGRPDPFGQGLTLREMADCYKKGAGLFGQYSSFLWQAPERRFQPVVYPDPVTFSDLIGIESQKNVLIQNTIQFIKGYPANNILLYGDRGTGKSSSIKALHNWFAAAGLRIIEINKEDLTDFPLVISFLRIRGLKFILYVDDLSFEADEVMYKHLKAVLEGGLEVKPANVLIYATSNRRHLIRETFGDRDDDLHSNDAVQERLSLADRFGITLTFSTPSQAEYLEIVTCLAKLRQLKVPLEEVETRAVQWAMLHNGRSGRTAKQFIDQLQGEMSSTSP
jgi:predicted AAA+ superfamily ATPase